jgi:hypothetical protein
MKWTWIIVLVLLFLLFHDKIGAEIDSLTGRPPARPYDPYGSPPPGPSYYSSSPAAPHSSVTDVLNSLINAGTSVYNGVVKSRASPPGVGGYAAGPGPDGGYG